MDRRLLDASQSGNVNALHSLLEDEPKILDHIEAIPYARTPLHIAIIAGNSSIAMEIATMRPSLTTKFDSFGYTPIHLASERGQSEVIKYFLEINPSTLMFIRDSGQEKRTALHCAVIAGHVDVIDVLVGFNPFCILELTGMNESVFHLAVKNQQVGSFMVLVGWLHELVKCEWNYEFGRKIENILNWKDDHGNTVTHLATLTKQHQMMAALLNCKSSLASRNRVEPNTFNYDNSNDLRAFIIQLQQLLPREKQDHARSTKEIILQTVGGTNTTFDWSTNIATAGRIIGLLAMLLLGITCYITGGTKPPQTISYYLLYAFIVVTVIGLLFLSLVTLVDAAIREMACLFRRYD